MLIRKRGKHDLRSSEITPESVYLNRRQFIERSGRIGLTAAFAPGVLAACERTGRTANAADAVPVPGEPSQEVDWSRMRSELGEELSSYEAVTTYNNFYEFGTGKEDPARNAHTLQPRPWSIAVEGEVANPAVYDLEEFLAPHRMEDRVYRMRCVEAWSMVIPWRGFPLVDLIRRVEPNGNAKFVELTTLYDPEQMPGQRRGVLDWPYVEGLRLDEATHPLTMLVAGVYGRELPNQNGAPLRLIVPWKYGFKGVKSIVKIRFVRDMPATTWAISAPNEYGFYANVNPEVDHPRWSQATERRIGEFRRRETLPFNGYADQVAHLYAGMDPRTLY